MPGIHNEDSQLSRGRPIQIGRHQRFPCFPHRLRDLGVSVSGQVHEDTIVVDPKEIHLPGAARSGTGSRHPFPPKQGVDEARLPDIGATREDHLG